MTRLISEWISNIENEIDQYDEILKTRLGKGLFELACIASNVSENTLKAKANSDTVYVVPITSGLGEIGHFAESVRVIISKLGFSTKISKQTDVAGFYEAIKKGANLIFMADDNAFIAFNTDRNIAINNDEATARGFFAAYNEIYKKLGQDQIKTALVGAGKVGSLIMELMIINKIDFAVLEKNLKIKESLVKKEIKQINEPLDLIDFDIIIDASSEGFFIKSEMLKEGVWVVGPGVPLALDNEAVANNKDRIVHDYLPIGTATMLAMAYK
ncbi:MAG: 3-methylornithyl-N6-L-lysine dehydrogenase PylD [Eubacteriales bacterium]